MPFCIVGQRLDKVNLALQPPGFEPLQIIRIYSLKVSCGKPLDIRSRGLYNPTTFEAGPDPGAANRPSGGEDFPFYQFCFCEKKPASERPAGDRRHMAIRDPNVCSALFLTVGAAWMDLRSTKVDNGWLLFWLGVSVAAQAARAGPEILLQILSGMAVPLLLLFPFFYFRMLGAADIKLLAVLGSFLGRKAILSCLFYTFLCAAVLSLFTFIFDGGIKKRIRYLAGWLQQYLETGQRLPYLRSGLREESLHMTVPMLMAVLLWAGGWY